MKKIIGLDIGGTKCAVILAEVTNETINIVDKIKFPTETEKGFEYTKNKLFNSIYEILNKNSVDKNNINAIGVSCGGPLNSKAGKILCPPNLPGWVNIPIVEMLESEFGINAYLQNDAKACALVEWRLGAGKGSNDMIFLTMGTGMGSGIISDGKLQLGACDMFGEVGHIRLEEDGPIGFGKYGSFEGFCSGGGIARYAKDLSLKAIAKGKPFDFAKSEKEANELTTEVLATFAKNGDENATKIFRFVGEKLGKGISYLIDILNPERIIIGSIFVRCEELLRPSMEKVLKEECLNFSLDVCKVLPAETGEKIGDLAAVMVGLEGIEYSFSRKDNPTVLNEFNKLFERYPSLNKNKNEIFNAYEILKSTYEKGCKVLCCGNGGSAADCDHIVGELMKGFKLQRKNFDIKNQFIEEDDYNYLKNNLQGSLPAISLTQHNALSTAYLNDVAYDMVFAQQVYGYGKKNDTLICISTSGNSKNVFKAAQTAKLMGIKIVSLTGNKKSKLSEISDITIMVEGNETAEIQELHLPVYHTLCSMLEKNFFVE